MKTKDNSKADPATGNRAKPSGKPLPPSEYSVVIETEENSSPEFVEQVILRVFMPAARELAKLRTQLLATGRVECGVYAREIAETKVEEVLSLADDNEHKMDCFVEPQSSKTKA